MADIDAIVRTYAPSELPEWTAQRQDDVLAAIIDDAPSAPPSVRIPIAFTAPRRRRHRIGIAASVVALTAVASGSRGDRGRQRGRQRGRRFDA